MTIHDKLIKLLENSYCVYSNVKVASIIIDNNNNEVKGVNVENASFGGTICAERSALCSYISQFGIGDIKEIHIISNMKNYLYPCGLCRQSFVELLNNKTKIVMHKLSSEKTIINSLKDLMPNAVTKDSIQWKK